MLRNISSTVPDRLLARLTEVPSGEWIAITSTTTASAHPRTVTVESPLETTVEAILTALPISSEAPIPLAGWIDDPTDDAGLDAFFAVQGMARDIERRPLEMGRLPHLPQDPWRNVATLVVVPSPVPFAFFLCVGRGEHVPVTLFGTAQRAAA